MVQNDLKVIPNSIQVRLQIDPKVIHKATSHPNSFLDAFWLRFESMFDTKSRLKNCQKWRSVFALVFGLIQTLQPSCAWGFLTGWKRVGSSCSGGQFPQQAPDGSPSVKWMFPHEYAASKFLAYSVVALLPLSWRLSHATMSPQCRLNVAWMSP